MGNNYSNKNTGNNRQPSNIPEKGQNIGNSYQRGVENRRVNGNFRQNNSVTQPSRDNRPLAQRNNIQMNQKTPTVRHLRKGRKNINWGDEIVNALKLVGRVSLRILSYIVNILLTILLIGILAGTIIAGAFLYYVSNYVDGNMADFDMMLVDQDASTSIYYMDWSNRETGVGEEIEIESQRLYASENRSIVSYDSVPKDLINAYVAVEDHRF